jgi:hypothetical protein
MPGELVREDGDEGRGDNGRKVAGADGDGEGKEGGGAMLSTLSVKV